MFNNGEFSLQDIELNNEIDKLEMEKQVSMQTPPLADAAKPSSSEAKMEDSSELHNPFTLFEIVTNQYSDILPDLPTLQQNLTYHHIELKNHVFEPPIVHINIPSNSFKNVAMTKLKKIQPLIRAEDNEVENAKANADSLKRKPKLDSYKHLSKKHRQLKIYQEQIQNTASNSAELSSSSNSSSSNAGLNIETSNTIGEKAKINIHFKSKKLPELAVKLMNDWFEAHIDFPYPNDDERRFLAQTGQIQENQVKAWFANKRNRSSYAKHKKTIEQENKRNQEQMHSKNFTFTTSANAPSIASSLNTNLNPMLASSFSDNNLCDAYLFNSFNSSDTKAKKHRVERQEKHSSNNEILSVPALHFNSNSQNYSPIQNQLGQLNFPQNQFLYANYNPSINNSNNSHLHSHHLSRQQHQQQHQQHQHHHHHHHHSNYNQNPVYPILNNNCNNNIYVIRPQTNTLNPQNSSDLSNLTFSQAKNNILNDLNLTQKAQIMNMNSSYAFNSSFSKSNANNMPPNLSMTLNPNHMKPPNSFNSIDYQPDLNNNTTTNNTNINSNSNTNSIVCANYNENFNTPQYLANLNDSLGIFNAQNFCNNYESCNSNYNMFNNNYDCSMHDTNQASFNYTLNSNNNSFNYASNFSCNTPPPILIKPSTCSKATNNQPLNLSMNNNSSSSNANTRSSSPLKQSSIGCSAQTTSNNSHNLIIDAINYYLSKVSSATNQSNQQKNQSQIASKTSAETHDSKFTDSRAKDWCLNSHPRLANTLLNLNANLSNNNNNNNSSSSSKQNDNDDNTRE